MARLILKAPYYSPKSKTPSGNTRGGYATYIATREGVEVLRSGMASYVGERRGSCGLFSDEGVPIVMSKITDEIDNHNGNVWGFIISLKRDDSERLGYNNALSWMNLLRSRRNDIAKEMHISPENLRWYGAYHDKEDHPHVHVLVWSDNPNEPHLSKDGIRNIKKVLAEDIFRQDLMCIYKEQTKYRDDLRREYRERMEDIAEKIKRGDLNCPELEMKFILLAKRLEQHKGKKQYGYLDKKSKELVNDIVKLIAQDKNVSELYDLWYKSLCEVHSTYSDKLPEKVPLWENEAFKPIKNAVVKAASGFSLPDDVEIINDDKQEDDVSYRYYLIGKNRIKDNKPEEAEYYLKEAVELGNHHAAFLLYKCYRDKVIEAEYKTSAKHYLYQAADMGNSAAEYILGKELLTKNPDKAKEYLLSSASKNNPQSMYLLGKVLLDEGKIVEALKWLDASAKLDLWNMTQVGLLYYYSLDERERGVELLRTAASDGYSSAKKALQAIEDGGDAQILCQCLWLFAYVSDIIEEETNKQTVRYDVVDSKLRREIAQKKRSGPVMRM